MTAPDKVDLDDLGLPDEAKEEVAKQFEEWEAEYRKALDEFIANRLDKDKPDDKPKPPSTDWKVPKLK